MALRSGRLRTIAVRRIPSHHMGRVKAVSAAERNNCRQMDHAACGRSSASPVCTHCNDGAGHLGVASRTRFGKSYAAPVRRKACSDGFGLRIYSNLGSLTRFTFDTLDDGRPAPANAQAFFASCIAAQNYSSNPSGWLVFHGPPGSGKTHLAAAIANRLIENERIVLFVTASDLLDELRAGYSPDNDMSFSEYTSGYQRRKSSSLTPSAYPA